MGYEPREGISIDRTFVISSGTINSVAGQPVERIIGVEFADYKTLAGKLAEAEIKLNESLSTTLRGTNFAEGPFLESRTRIPVSDLAEGVEIDNYHLTTEDGKLEISLRNYWERTGGSAHEGIIGGSISSVHGIEGSITGKATRYEELRGMNDLQDRMQKAEEAITKLYDSLRGKDLPGGMRLTIPAKKRGRVIHNTPFDNTRFK